MAENMQLVHIKAKKQKLIKDNEKEIKYLRKEVDRFLFMIDNKDYGPNKTEKNCWGMVYANVNTICNLHKSIEDAKIVLDLLAKGEQQRKLENKSK